MKKVWTRKEQTRLIELVAQNTSLFKYGNRMCKRIDWLTIGIIMFNEFSHRRTTQTMKVRLGLARKQQRSINYGQII